MRAIISIYNVIQGFVSLLWSLVTKRISMQAYHRAEVCYECCRRSGSWCSACGCYIPAKVRAKHARCPLGYWAVAKIGRIPGGVRARGACD